MTLTLELARRIQQVSPSPTLAITAKAKQLKQEGVDVIGLGAGEPDFNTPLHVIEAAYQSMRDGKTKYTPSGGIPELKKAIARRLKENGLEYAPEQIIVTTGAKHALYNLFQVILNPGDEVIIPAPYWVSYPEQVKLADGVPVFVEGKEEQGFKVTPEQVEAAVTPRTKALILNSPSNPTGAVYTEEELRALGKLALRHNFWIVSDEIYEKLIYEGKHVSIASLGQELYERTIVINGVSKSYSMTGWRIGYAAGDQKVIKAMVNLSSHSTSNPATMSQYGALAALEGEQTPVEEMRRAFLERRNRIVPLLNEIPGLKCPLPPGAFYLFVNIEEAMQKGGYRNADEWSEALLEEEKVAVVPGTGFGSPKHIRISYAYSLEYLLEGIRRIRRFVERNV